MEKQKFYFGFIVLLLAAVVLISGCTSDSESTPPSKVDPTPNGEETPSETGTTAGKELLGTWKGTVTEELHGLEGSFPPGCSIEQMIQFDFMQSGNALSGTMTTVLTKITGCSPIMPSSMVGTEATSRLSGTVTDSSATFSSEDPANLGAADFTVTFTEDALSGKVVTCHSPDPRCTCDTPDQRCPGGVVNGNPVPGHLETINWWTGDLTATRTK